MAPEVLAGGPATPRSDIYSLGVLLYRLLTDAFPVMAAQLSELRAAHAERRAVTVVAQRPDLPPAVARVIERACDRDPARRPSSANELEAELRDALRESLESRAAVRSSAERWWMRWRRPVLTTLASGAILLATLAAGWNTNPGRAARRAAGFAVPPRSPLYLTIGGALGIVRNGALRIVPYNPAPAMPIAVSLGHGVRTAAGVPIWTGNAWFDLDGTPRPQGPPTLDGLCCFYDGTTDGRHNYAIRADSTLLEPVGSRPLEPTTLYRFALDWTRPEPVFVLGSEAMRPVLHSYYSAIAYDPSSDTFWVVRSEPEQSTIEQWSRDGQRLTTLSTVSWNIPGIALDHADGTLWAIQYMPNASVIHLDNFDRGGRHLGSIELPRPVSDAAAIGAEFVLTGPE
jgi:hypothetical protein